MCINRFKLGIDASDLFTPACYKTDYIIERCNKVILDIANKAYSQDVNNVCLNIHFTIIKILYPVRNCTYHNPLKTIWVKKAH